MNAHERSRPDRRNLNESPSEKEGKYGDISTHRHLNKTSMKVPPKRKGNLITASAGATDDAPQ
mgnify:CR=1 FL=1